MNNGRHKSTGNPAAASKPKAERTLNSGSPSTSLEKSRIAPAHNRSHAAHLNGPMDPHPKPAVDLRSAALFSAGRKQP